MARNVSVVSLSSVAVSPPIQIDLPVSAAAWVGAGLLLNFSSGASATATVEISGDGNVWNPHETFNAVTASTNGNLSYPVGFVRLRLTARSGGTVTLTVIQVPGL